MQTRYLSLEDEFALFPSASFQPHLLTVCAMCCDPESEYLLAAQKRQQAVFCTYHCFIYYYHSFILKVPHSVTDHLKTVALMKRSSTWWTPAQEDYFSPTVKWVRRHVKLSYFGRHSEATEKSNLRARQGKLSADSRWAQIQDQMTAANLSAYATGHICWCGVLTNEAVHWEPVRSVVLRVRL